MCKRVYDASLRHNKRVTRSAYAKYLCGLFSGAILNFVYPDAPNQFRALQQPGFETPKHLRVSNGGVGSSIESPPRSLGVRQHMPTRSCLRRISLNSLRGLPCPIRFDCAVPARQNEDFPRIPSEHIANQLSPRVMTPMQTFGGSAPKKGTLKGCSVELLRSNPGSSPAWVPSAQPAL